MPTAPPVVRIKEVWRHCQCPLGGKISPVENYWVNAYTLCYFLKLKLTALPKPFQALQITYFQGTWPLSQSSIWLPFLRNHHYLNSSNIKISNSSHSPRPFCLLPLFSSNWICQSQFTNAQPRVMCTWSHLWTPEYCLIDLRNHQDHLNASWHLTET